MVRDGLLQRPDATTHSATKRRNLIPSRQPGQQKRADEIVLLSVPLRTHRFHDNRQPDGQKRIRRGRVVGSQPVASWKPQSPHRTHMSPLPAKNAVISTSTPWAAAPRPRITGRRGDNISACCWKMVINRDSNSGVSRLFSCYVFSQESCKEQRTSRRLADGIQEVSTLRFDKHGQKRHCVRGTKWLTGLGQPCCCHEFSLYSTLSNSPLAMETQLRPSELTICQVSTLPMFGTLSRFRFGGRFANGVQS